MFFSFILFFFNFKIFFLLIFRIVGVPVWPLIFYCLRCGDVSAAIQAADEAGPGKLSIFLPSDKKCKINSKSKNQDFSPKALLPQA